MSAPPVKSTARQEQRLHPLPVRVMHWTNAVAIFIMIGSGWKIYNDDVIFGWLHFPDAVVIGKWAQYGLQWHFFGMWIFVLNGLAYLIYGIATGRFGESCFRFRCAKSWRRSATRCAFASRHDDLTHYNAVQKILYLGIMAGRRSHRDLRAGAVEAGAVLRAGVAVRQFPDHPAGAFPLHVGDRGFLLVHVTLALLVPQSLVAMLTGGPAVDDEPAVPTPRPKQRPDAVNTCRSHPHAIDLPAEDSRSTRAC